MKFTMTIILSAFDIGSSCSTYYAAAIDKIMEFTMSIILTVVNIGLLSVYYYMNGRNESEFCEK